MRDPLVTALGLTKRFDDFVAVDHVSFDIHRGEVFGFLGPNGAGKSSTMRMIGATSPITEGHLRVFGLDPASDGREIRSRLGVIPQEDMLDEELTVTDNLVVYGRYFDLPRSVIRPRVDELLDFAQLTEKRNAKVESLSGGMKRRLAIARALVSDPELVILDEPTTGLDPQARHVLWDRLYRLKQRGATLIITTHYMDEAEQLCDRLVVMDRGKIVAEGSPSSLIAEHATPEVLEVRLDVDDHADHADPLTGIGSRTEVLADRVLLYVDHADKALMEVRDRGIIPSATVKRRASLEDVFLHLTGRTLVD